MKSSTRTVAVGLVAVAIQALMVLAFAWPSARLEPRHLPLVVAGPAAATTPVARRLEAEHPGAFDLRRVPDQSAARRALADREAYGAIVVTPAGPQVLVASAASPAVAQLLAQMGQRMSGRPLPTVQDVVAADRDDPRGAAFSALALPLVISGLAAGILLMFAVPGAGRRLAGLLIFAVGAGLTSAAIVHGWLSVLSGSYLAVAGVIGLVSLAVAAPVAGLAAVLGRPGLGLGGLAMLLPANPLSGVTSAPELLPEPWGAIGQGMPAGAGGTLLRSVSFFDGARAGWPLTVLLIWAGAGLLLVAVGGLRDRMDPGGLPARAAAPAPVA